MLVYRCVSEREIACMIGIQNHINAPHGKNTFQYKNNIVYKHFFYFYESAITFMNIQNRDRYYDKYTLIMIYDIDTKILKEHFGLGEYNLFCVPDKYKDELLKYFKTIYYPEFAIPDSLITNDMIVGIGNQKRITPISYVHYDSMDMATTENEKRFLEYEKWLLNNGTNVSIEKILERKGSLFPIKEKQKQL